nr:TPA: yrdC domain protein [Toxoplasma gondii VEG]
MARHPEAPAGEAQPSSPSSCPSPLPSSLDHILFTSCPPVLVFRAPPRASSSEEQKAFSQSLLDSPSVKLLPSAPSLLRLFHRAAPSSSSSPPSSSSSSSPSSSSSSSPSSSPTSSPSSSSSSSPSSPSSSSPFATLSQLRELSVHPLFEALGAYFRRGGLVAFPTETVYGLGAAATLPHACSRVFRCKKRPASDPLICHVVSVQQAFEQVYDLDEGETEEAARGESLSLQEKRDLRVLIATLADAFWPGPLSIVAKGKILEDRRDGKGVALAVTAGTRFVAARCPNHPYALSLIAAAGVPIVAPSANRFGRISPTRASHVINQFADSPTEAISSLSSLSSLCSSSLVSAEGDCATREEGSVGNGAETRDSKKRRVGTVGERKFLTKTELSTHLAEHPDGDEMVLLDGAEEDCCCLGIESTVIKVSPPGRDSKEKVYDIQVLRRGVISAGMIAETLEAVARRPCPSLSAASGLSTSFPAFCVRVSEKLQYHLSLENRLSPLPASPLSTDECSAAQPRSSSRGEATLGDCGVSRRAASETSERESEEQTTETREQTEGRQLPTSSLHALEKSLAKTAGDVDTPMESPGLALTHYAPCLPCMLIVSRERGMASSTGGEHEGCGETSRTREVDEVDAATETPVGGIDGAAAVVIDADRSLYPLKRQFLKYISIVSPVGDGGGETAAGAETEAANGESPDTTAREADEDEEERWTRLAQIAAGNVFAALHEAEAAGLQLGASAILINASPLLKGREHGLAVFDRLFRAASGKTAAMLSAGSASPSGAVRFVPLS